jgi:hypothetical protein
VVVIAVTALGAVSERLVERMGVLGDSHPMRSDSTRVLIVVAAACKASAGLSVPGGLGLQIWNRCVVDEIDGAPEAQQGYDSMR